MAGPVREALKRGLAVVDALRPHLIIKRDLSEILSFQEAGEAEAAGAGGGAAAKESEGPILSMISRILARIRMRIRRVRQAIRGQVASEEAEDLSEQFSLEAEDIDYVEGNDSTAGEEATMSAQSYAVDYYSKPKKRSPYVA